MHWNCHFLGGMLKISLQIPSSHQICWILLEQGGACGTVDSRNMSRQMAVSATKEPTSCRPVLNFLLDKEHLSNRLGWSAGERSRLNVRTNQWGGCHFVCFVTHPLPG